MRQFLAKYSLYFAWVISLVGLLVSLYVGEGLKMEPCHLCWYQRIFLFPLAILLGVATFREDHRFALYAFVMACLGEFFALYQVLQQHIPVLKASALCGTYSDCSETVFQLFGFLTFPLLSAVGFAMIAILLWPAAKASSTK